MKNGNFCDIIQIKNGGDAEMENKIFIFKWLISILVGLIAIIIAVIGFIISYIVMGIAFSLFGVAIIDWYFAFVPHSFLSDDSFIW